MLIDRLIFGCSRVTGGASLRASSALLRQLLDGGIRHFDTAPSYGLGMAEEVVGRVTVGRSDVRITAKAGKEPDPHGWLKSYARVLKNRVRPRPPMLSAEFEPGAPLARSPSGDFSEATLNRSLARTMDRLRRDTVDLLVLHEAYREDATRDALAFLERAKASGAAGAVGYSNGAIFDPATTAAFPAHFLAQTAIRPEWLYGPAPAAPGQPVNLHSIAKIGLYAKRTNAGFAARLNRAADMLGQELDERSRELVSLFALIHERFPAAGLLFASLDPNRTAAFLFGVDRIDRSIGAARLAAAFDP